MAFWLQSFWRADTRTKENLSVQPIMQFSVADNTISGVSISQDNDENPFIFIQDTVTMETLYSQ